jgi:hypothetical protein
MLGGVGSAGRGIVLVCHFGLMSVEGIEMR